MGAPIPVAPGATRFEDNGIYVGHDEPSVKFISSAPGSGNSMSYLMRLPRDPKGKPTISPNGKTVSDYAELSPAPWFGLPICDPNSYPLNPCKPDSDTNSGAINDPNAAGSAFLEVQLYPPGYQPFVDSPSCDRDSLVRGTHHRQPGIAVQLRRAQRRIARNRPTSPSCSAMACPAGPPSPQLSDVSTFTPNSADAPDEPGRRARPEPA